MAERAEQRTLPQEREAALAELAVPGHLRTMTEVAAGIVMARQTPGLAAVERAVYR
jgi:hypothetical protein